MAYGPLLKELQLYCSARLGDLQIYLPNQPLVGECMNIVKKIISLGLTLCFLFTIPVPTGYAIGVEPPPARYAEQEYNNAVDILASQNIHRQFGREKTAYLACFLGWTGGENFYLRQYVRFGIFLTFVIITVPAGGIPLIAVLPLGIYSFINGRAYFAMTDQQFDQIHNPGFFGQVEQTIRSKKEEGQQKVTTLNKTLSDCRALYDAGTYDKALNACQSVESECGVTTDKDLKSKTHELMGLIYEKLGDQLSARKEFAKAISNAQNPTSKANLEQGFKRTENTFVKTFLKEDYDNRKLIMPVDNTQKMALSEHINILNVKNLPDIEFRNGNPTINQLYVGHPYINKQYIPFEDSQYEFMRDRIGEFFELMQALGAKTVEVQSITINKKEYGLEKNTETGGKISADPSKIVGKLGPLSAILSKVLPQDPVSAGGTRKTEENKSASESAFRDLKIKQVFKPQNKPALPRGLIWYAHEPSWQRLYKQRMHGNLLKHTEKISTKNNKVIQDSELSQIGGELEILLGGIGSNRAKTIKQKMEYQEDVELTINVSFAPLNTLN